MAATANLPLGIIPPRIDPYAVLARSIVLGDWRSAPRIVYYIAGRITYVKPDQYFFGYPTDPGLMGPSDSVWIVPGTLG